MRTPSLRRLRSALAVPVVLAAVATVATACGEGGGDRDDSSSAETDGTTGGESDTSSEGSAPDGAAAGDGHSRTLSAEEAEQASITVTNLGAGWTERPVDEKEGSTPGCLGIAETVINNFDTAAEAKKEFGYGDEGFPVVDSEIASYENGAIAVLLFDQVEKLLDGCPTIEETDSDGVTWNLELSPQTDMALDDIAIDDQFTFAASGSVTSEGQRIPLVYHWTAIRSGSTILTINASATENISDQHEQVTTVAAHRLAAVIAGETPPDTVVPAP